MGYVVRQRHQDGTERGGPSRLKAPRNATSSIGQIYRYFVKLGKPVSCAEVAKGCGLGLDTVGRVIWDNANKQRYFRRYTYGLYTLIDDLREPSAEEVAEATPAPPANPKYIPTPPRPAPPPEPATAQVAPGNGRNVHLVTMAPRNEMFRCKLCKKTRPERVGFLYFGCKSIDAAELDIED